MADRLPSLTALRAFEAAARHLSFAAAAEELRVTPAALSFQIKGLESDLGTPLFRRLTRAVELTDAGHALAPHTTRAMEALREGWQETRRRAQVNRLTITAAPAFTSKWLAPRMGDFAAAHPDIELRLASSLKVLDFDRDGIDLALRFGRGLPEGQSAERLLDEYLLPLTTPAIAARLTRPEDLLGETLIRDESLAFLGDYPGWDDWLQAAGLNTPPPKGPVFTQADHSLDMGAEGGGVVLGRFLLAQSNLRAGLLVAPFCLALRLPASYRIVSPAGRPDSPAAAAFRAWLKTQASRCDGMARGLDARPWPP